MLMPPVASTLFVLLLAVLPVSESWQIKRQSPEPVAMEIDEGVQPSIFIAVFSRYDSVERRSGIRRMWQLAQGNSSNMTYKFIACAGLDDEGLDADGNPNMEAIALNDDELAAQLQDEYENAGDVLWLRCEEGYLHGALTQRVLASMRAFWDIYRRDYFMKIDDDTFLSWNRYAPKLNRVGHPYIYMGVPINEGVPCRNESFRWYEPYSTFDDEIYPRGMAGGPGYTIGNALVDLVINTGVGDQHVLWNEDRAVGVWMDIINNTGIFVQHISLNGIEGYWSWDADHPVKEWSTWGSYPYMVHHGLHAATIACLGDADAVNDSSTDIKSCYRNELGTVHEKLTCSTMNLRGKQLQAPLLEEE